MVSEHNHEDGELKDELTENSTPESTQAPYEPVAVSTGTVGEEEPDTNDPGEQLSEIEVLNRKLELVTHQAQENLDLAQRTQAEMDNLRKRTIRDIENAYKYSLDKIISELLPVVDSIELGIQASESDEADTLSGIRDGLDLTLKKFIDTLLQFGVEVIDPEGEKFNPEKHDAVSMHETNETEQGMVISVLQKGYELNGRLVRPAKVIVSQ